MLRVTWLTAAVLAWAPVLAQDYGGTYTAKNASGGTLMLTLAQDAQKRASGSLTGHGRASLQVQARIDGDALSGTAANTFGMLYLTGRLKGDELSLVLTEPDVGGKPNPQRATLVRLTKVQAKSAPQNAELTQALTRNAWCSFAYTISGNQSKERLVFMSNGLVNQTPGRQARWRVQNETLEFSRDGFSWSPEPLRLALSAGGAPVLKAHDKEFVQCD
jgi:hypothetical protein